MHRITVLGGSGFLGSHLCDILSNKGYYVKIFDLKKSKKLKKKQKMYLGNINSTLEESSSPSPTKEILGIKDLKP